MYQIDISDTTQAALTSAAQEAQAWFERENGEHYPVSALHQVFAQWLEASLEQLAQEALYHCVEGDPMFAFNRVAFRDRLSKLAPAYTPAEADKLAA